MEILEISVEMGSKNRLSRALATVFPNCVKKRVIRNNKQMYPFHKYNLLVNLLQF